MIQFETSSGKNELYGMAQSVEGIAYVIRFGEQLTNLELPDMELPYIPVVLDEVRRDEKRFRDLTPSAVGQLACSAGFLTLGRSERGRPTHIATVLRGLNDRTDFLGLSCYLESYEYDLDEVEQIQATLAGWNGSRITMAKTDGHITISRL